MLWTISFVEFHEYVSVAHEFIEIEGLDSTDESSDEEPVSHKKATRVKFSRAPIKVPVNSTDSQRSLLRQKEIDSRAEFPCGKLCQSVKLFYSVLRL